ncbi:LacI family DNA-binding transcriptional regulator [Phytoactinopolyspora endophytica]|uniref:LacI family DNA-binding transcriptional regulator n=1 Tax=Phytoactinopolyspora endophytica TaxID=1642495 RepID=UPI0013ED0520|nr:LacI family DNA-binding transcriptional regulator [Phytoactinopolyspora endophytica]
MSDDNPAAVHRIGNRKPAATIYDVAEVVGVSPSTVSRALNKPGRINAKTEERIRHAAEALGYRLNPMARALLTGKTAMVALLVSDITNPVFYDIVRGAENVATEAGYTLVFAESHQRSDIEFATVERLQPSVDGVLVVASLLDEDQIAQLSETKPIVIALRPVEGIPHVVPNSETGLVQAVDHLQELGHRSIGYLSGPTTFWANRHRWNILFEHAVAKGMSIVEIPPDDPVPNGGATRLRRILASGVTAVVVYNDLMAIGLISECKREGVDVPGRLSIVGFDDVYGANLISPSLTTIDSSLGKVGGAAMWCLLAEVDGTTGYEPPELPTRLIVRESTASAPS